MAQNPQQVLFDIAKSHQDIADSLAKLAESQGPDIWAMAANIGVLVAAISTVAGVWIAFAQWRKDRIAERHQILAEETLLAFYQMEDIIKGIRWPGRLNGEGESRPDRDKDEDDNKRYVKDGWYVTQERVRANRDFYQQFGVLRDRCRVVFNDDELTKAFKNLDVLIVRLVINSRKLVKSVDRDHFRTKEQEQSYVDKNDEFEKIIWDMSDLDKPDSIAQQVSEAVDKARNTLASYLR